MYTKEVLKAWAAILNGRAPSMSIEITKECPLRCPGCYAYEDEHLAGGVTLRQLVDHKGDQLVQGVLDLVDRERPLHLSIVGGDPLVRLRELEVLLPQLVQRGIYVQVVTSAFRAIPKSWASFSGFNLVVSIDGLQPEHDERRKPATYARILKNIEGQKVIVHCTITGQMMKREGYLEEFFRFWAPRPEIKKIWVSFFTPQRGAESPECLSVEERDRAIAELLRLRRIFPKFDVGAGTLREFAKPPASPKDCIFARTTLTLSADLKTKITPCQFGGDPDCTRCGCIASMGLAAVGSTKLGGILPVRHIFMASARIGEVMARSRDRDERPIPPATAPSPSVVR
ncbi:MAG: radical SAM protein [Candidatus Acidiferrales bacterium]